MSLRLSKRSPRPKCFERLQIEVDDSKSRALDKLAKLCELRTRKALFNEATALFEWAVNERLAGRKICSLLILDSAKTEPIKELVMASLENAARKGKIN